MWQLVSFDAGVDPNLVKALVGGIAVVSAAAVTAVLQYAAKVREERRLLRVSLVEADTKVAGAFGELIGRSHGRGRSEMSEALVQALFTEGELADTVKETYAEWIRTAPDKPAALREVLRSLPITHPIGTDDMDATLQVLAALGRKHDILTRAALGAVEGRATWKPLPGAPGLIADLKKHEKWNRMGRIKRLLNPRSRP
ncbi:hypothetical protein ACIOHH_20825 [Streptomyces microflavus]|uniref:hypothetical protein n=1 Tax=Streptomyces microflavus TaxID=1919 RepID=UPI0037F669B2